MTQLKYKPILHCYRVDCELRVQVRADVWAADEDGASIDLTELIENKLKGSPDELCKLHYAEPDWWDGTVEKWDE